MELELIEQEVKEGMKKEMKSMKGVEVYDEIPIENCSQEDIDKNWTALGLCVGKHPAKFPVDWLHVDVSKRTWTLTTLSPLLLLLSRFALAR